jgi:hypothetical protein
MIHLVIGKQGSGKTLFMVAKAYAAWKKRRTIYSNVMLKFPFKKLDYHEIIDCKLENGMVMLDEIHQLLPARRSMRKINVEICDGFISMVRKKNLEVYGSTQTLRKVDVRFVEEADYIYLCEKFAWQNGMWAKVVHNENMDAKLPILIKVIVKEICSGEELEFTFHGNPYFKMFDTNQVIKISGLEV